SALASSFAALVARRPTNRLQCHSSGGRLEYLPSLERRRHAAANTPKRAESDGCELVTGRKFTGLRHRERVPCGLKRRPDLHHRPQVQARFHLAWFKWTFFPSMVAGWQVRCCHHIQPTIQVDAL